MNEPLMNATIALADRCADRDSSLTSQDARVIAQELAHVYGLDGCDRDVLFDAAESFAAPLEEPLEDLIYSAAVSADRAERSGIEAELALASEWAPSSLPSQWRQVSRDLTIPSGPSTAEMPEPAIVQVPPRPRRRSEPLDPLVTSDQPSGPLDPPVASDRPWIALADPPVAAGRRRPESLDPLVASYRRLSESLDRPVASPRSAKTGTTLNCVVVSDVNTSAQTVLRSRFARSRIAASTAAGIVVLLVVLTWTRLAPQERGSEETAGAGTPGAGHELATPPAPAHDVGTVAVTSVSGTGNVDQPAPQTQVVSLQAVPVPSQPAPVSMPRTRVAAPVLAPSFETRYGAAGHSRDLVERVAERWRTGVSVDDEPPPIVVHHKAPSSAVRPTAKLAIPDPSATLVNHAGPANSTIPAKATPETPPPREKLADPPAAPLLLSCAAVEKDAAPGQQLRIRCESTNPNESATHVKSVDVAVGTGAALGAVGQGLPDIAPHGHVEFEVTPTLPRSVKAGSLLPITITMTINTPEFAPVHQQILIRVTPAGMCTQGKLTRDAYEAKRKRMQDALKSGALNQAEYDRYDAEIVSCLE
jgi:hypothetical protein